MHCTVFYSWQSDTLSKYNRGFIEGTLKKAVKQIRDDETIVVEPVVDRDTANVPGAPEIASSIFDKIDNASVFVADVSIINQEGKKCPNPNVLIELGYAAKALGWSNIILVMNTAYGAVSELPFDLRARRTVCYSVSDRDADKTEQRTNLIRLLNSRLREIFGESRSSFAAAAKRKKLLGERIPDLVLLFAGSREEGSATISGPLSVNETKEIIRSATTENPPIPKRDPQSARASTCATNAAQTAEPKGMLLEELIASLTRA